MAINEALVLDGLALNDGTVFSLETFDMAPAPDLEEWIKGADSHGALLAREPLSDNVVRELRIRVEPQASMDTALAKVGLLIDKLQECKRNTNGLALTWIPATSTLPAVTARCLSGAITNLPVDWESGWLAFAPTLTVKLTCLPFWEGTETLLATVTSSEPLIALELTGVAGDVPALGRLVVTDAAAQSRRFVAWGLESRWYPTSSPPPLIIDSSSMITTGYAGVTATRSGAYSGASNNVIRATLQPHLQAICSLGNLTHVGQFRPQLRYYASATTIALLLTYQTLDGPFRSLSYSIPVAAGWNHVDLGLITIRAATLGAQRWIGRIEAYSTATGGETLDVDVCLVMPAERHGVARAARADVAGAISAYDGFTGSTDAAVLNGRTASVGGTWATSGDTTDFTTSDYVSGMWGTNVEILRRTTSSADAGAGRFAVAGSTFTDVEAGVSLTATGVGVKQAVGARWIDASNRLEASVTMNARNSAFAVSTVVAGVVTELASWTGPVAVYGPAIYTIRLIVFATGYGYAELTTRAGELVARLNFRATVLATGGALASGKAYLRDFRGAGATAQFREYDDFYAAALPAEDVVCNSSQSIEFRHDSTLRENAAGTHAGTPAEAIGSWFTIPPAGGPARKTRVAVIARRNDITVLPDDDIADSTTVDVYAKPRWLAIPR